MRDSLSKQRFLLFENQTSFEREEKEGFPYSDLEEDGIRFGETQRRQPRARLGKERQSEVPEVFFRRTLDVRVQVKTGRRRDVREETIEK